MLDLSRRAETVQALATAASDSGIAVLIGHGVPSEVIVRAHSAAAALFAVSDAEKSDTTTGGMGFRGLGREALAVSARDGSGDRDQKESFTARFDDGVCVPWPRSVPDAPAAFLEYHTYMLGLANRLLDLADEALPTTRRGTFRRLSGDNPSSVLRAFHYPPADSSDNRAGAHTDYGALTLISASGDSRGLQIQDRRGQEWTNVEAPPGGLVMHLGDIFERWTNGRWVAPPHRVVGPGSSRYSLTWFYAPSRDVVVAPLAECVEPAATPRFPPVLVGDYISARVAQRDRT